MKRLAFSARNNILYWGNIMNKSFFKSLVKPGVVLTMVAISGMANADAKQDLIEARQETQIWTTYALSPYLRANDLKVTVHDGKATLSGKVDDDVNKELAKEIALGVSGIKDVDNKITVQSDYNPKASRGYGEVIDDATITSVVRSKLVWSKHSYMSTKVDTKDGRVSLTGTVDSADAKSLAGRLAASTRGVAAVDNEIVVNAKPSKTETAKDAAHETGQSVADAWITTKVKSTLLYSSNVSGSDIDVTTNAGVVSLKGKLSSGAEHALAIELAQNVRGVKSVDAKSLTF